MVFDSKIAEQAAQYLLEIRAVKLQPHQPFTWASGWKSPVYCDNRVSLSYPHIRQFFAESFASLTQKHYSETTLVAGVATGAIAHGVLVAEQLQLPFAYIRSAAKGHGLENLIEGKIDAGDKVLVIEDLISTGMSSLKAVQALEEKKIHVLGMAAIFTYNFEKAQLAFEEKKCSLITLTDYSFLINTALKIGYINAADVDSLNQWRMNPAEWGK